MPADAIAAEILVAGSARGDILFSDVPLSFWGGVDSASGEVIDRHHPLSGQRLAGKILAIPSSRGSCSGSGVILELILNGQGPVAVLLERPDAIITLGVIVAEAVFGRSLPVLSLGKAGFAALRSIRHAAVRGGAVVPLANADTTLPAGDITETAPVPPAFDLSEKDRSILAGNHGRAAQVAMQIVLKMAAIEGAGRLIDVSQAHIDGCIYTGPGGLAFAEQLRDWGGRVAVPTTLNAISVDQRQWRVQGIDPGFGEPASGLADAYVAMGAEPTFTCAPYLLDTAPVIGEQIVWAESNAVVYANSVLGARTVKYPDYLDICIALTGRAPFSGPHTDAGRLPRLRITVPELVRIDDSFWPLLGYLIGGKADEDIPLIGGVADLSPSLDDLKAFGAAFATTSGAPMFHIAGVTPEALASDAADATLPTLALTMDDLRQAWGELNGGSSGAIQLVSLGNPHFSTTEIATLARLCEGRSKHEDVVLIVTCGRFTLEKARAAGHVAALEAFGVQFVTDTCWCMIVEPLIPKKTRTIMTNSGKYAHYGPGLTGKDFRFGSLAACIEAAVSGTCGDGLPAWLAAAAGD